MRYQVDFLLPLKLQKKYHAILGYAAKYPWPISLQDFFLWTCLIVNLNTGGPVLHCTCYYFTPCFPGSHS